ncbi:MAG: hypothetical protein IPM29_06130 [Planctomycetes bacterium]|nr:hypothetical protein [Planctomycetota bacterium]
MANQKGKDAFEFVRRYLEKKPGTPYAQVAEAAAAAGHKIWPIVFGRAQLLLGQAKPKGAKSKAGKKKAAAKAPMAKKRAAKKAPVSKAVAKQGKRGPGRPPKSQSVVALEGLMTHIQQVERERDQLQATLDKLRSLIGAH